MIKVGYKPAFVRELNRLESDLCKEVMEKIDAFRNEKNHAALKVHKLHASLADCHAFSVSYKIRIVFQYESKKGVVLLAIGDHDVYK